MNRALQILLVEDDPVGRLATRQRLAAGAVQAEVCDASSAREALSALVHGRFDCVLTDYHLADDDALALLRTARDAGVDCPFIILTGQGDEQLAVEIMKAGASDYLLKAQLSVERLGQAVRQATRLHRAELLRAEAQERQRKSAAQLKGLAEASLAINAATTLAQLVDIISRRAALLVGAHQATTSVIDGADWTLAINAVHLSDKYAPYRGFEAPPCGHGIYALVCESNRPLRLTHDELLVHPRFRHFGEQALDHPPLRGWLAAPLLGRDGSNFGLVQLSDKYEGEFDDDDEAVLVQLAQFASAAVENARLLAREQRARRHAEASAERISRLQAITTSLSNPAGVAEVMEIIVSQAVAHLRAEQAALFMLSADRSHLRLSARRNIDAALAERLRHIGIEESSMATRCLHQRQPLFYATHEDYARDALGDWDPRTRSALCVPLALSDWPPFGVVALSFTEPQHFAEDERTYVESLADQWAQALDRARLHASELSARKQAEVAREQAETANRLKDEFLATISHELRTPLQAILGWARLLRGQPLDERLTKGLETIERNARAQAQLIEDILDVSRVITGKLRLEPRCVDVGAIVQASADTLRAAAEAKHVTLTVLLEPELGQIVADPDRLQQVVWNLLSNAVKFTPPSGRVAVSAARQADEVVIRVEDSGRGIAPEFLPHVFERFRQADASSTRAHSGLGLGLSIVRHLTELHGGRVSAHSDGEQQGATFTLHLPVRGSLPPPAAIDANATTSALPSEEQPPAERLHDTRVLVVDDEVDARELIATVLAQAGAQVAAASSVREALEKLGEIAPHIIVSDIGMPGEDGFSLLKRVRALDSPWRDVPVLALTAFARSEERGRMLSAGFSQHLAKPIDPDALVCAVARLVARADHSAA
jgi:signal transduction histidine kinase/CheY-like chemotaxis protein